MTNINAPFIYDKYIVSFSGGKDSIACLLHLLDLGIPKEKIELWHADVDGRDDTLFDWEVTPAYCRAIAKAFDIPIYFMWKEGGFRGEMTRRNKATGRTIFEKPDGTLGFAGGKGRGGTRRKFPQISPDLSVRWCSAYLKIDICATALRNQDRFNDIKTVLITGERAEEALKGEKFREYLESVKSGKPVSAKGRAGYMYLEPDRADCTPSRAGQKSRVYRYVDHWRPIKDWTEQEVWDIIKRYQIRAHPAYYMGFSRCSCKFCIFGNADQFASAFRISPQIGQELVDYEDDFGVTMKRDKSLVELVSEGEPYDFITKELQTTATSHEYNESIFMADWYLPAGAFGESCGPS